VPYGEMHFDQGWVTKFYGRPREAFSYRDEMELSLQVGRGLIKPFWYGSIFTTPQGHAVDTSAKVESMIVRGGLAWKGSPPSRRARCARPSRIVAAWTSWLWYNWGAPSAMPGALPALRR